MKLDCPICKKVDRAAKVSAIVAGATVVNWSSGSGFGLSPSLSSEGWSLSASFQGQQMGGSYSALAGKLTLARESEGKSSDPISFVGYLCGSLFWLVIGIVAVAGTQEDPSLWWLAAFSGLGAIGLFTGVVSAAKSISGREKAKLTNQRREAAWNTLYYCHRDDVVYVPEYPDKCVSVDRMLSLLDR